jgi:hypothetical protein
MLSDSEAPLNFAYSPCIVRYRMSKGSSLSLRMTWWRKKRENQRYPLIKKISDSDHPR